MKGQLQSAIEASLATLRARGVVPAQGAISFQISRTRDKSHGDYACNVAMILAKVAKRPPRELAEAIVAQLPANDDVSKVEIAGPGFINFHLRESSLAVVNRILDAGEDFGFSDIGAGRKVQVEFVSTNPTGPLHVGHGRGAAYGATVANLLQAVGYDVQREYYINDAGRQIDILATSVWLRYLAIEGEEIEFPVNGYRGDYIGGIAAGLRREHGGAFRHTAVKVLAGVPPDEPAGDKETHIDGLIANAKTLLANGYETVLRTALDAMVADIREDLEEFGVAFDEWFSERSLMTSGAVDASTAQLSYNGYITEKDGAKWFRSTELGDDKDRVITRSNGQATYFASDIAYHKNKFDRGFERVIDVWGADHHGHVKRVSIALQALGYDPAKFEVLLVQMISLYRGDVKVPMSTRAGEFVTLRELREETGNDAARFFYVMRKREQPFDFDIELAKSQSADNPVYYIQYAHARVCSVVGELESRGLTLDLDNGKQNSALLTEDHEQALARRLSLYPDVVAAAAKMREPHQLTHYLRELANEFHTYYNAHQFLVDDTNLRDARLSLIVATQQVIRNGLALLGVSAPEHM
ncbi:MAG: arginine--tRNA ligase [Gammaproteobacteria bacterium]